MNIVVFDNSKGKAFKKTRRHFGKMLVSIGPRKFIGNLPSRIIKQTFDEIKTMVSKSSNILVLVAEKDGFHGWAGYYFGAPKFKAKYANLLFSNRYISL